MTSRANSQKEPISIPDKTSATKIHRHIPQIALFFKVKPTLPYKPVYHGNNEIDCPGDRNPVEFPGLYPLFKAICKIGLSPFPLALDIACADMLRVLELCRAGADAYVRLIRHLFYKPEMKIQECLDPLKRGPGLFFKGF